LKTGSNHPEKCVGSIGLSYFEWRIKLLSENGFVTPVFHTENRNGLDFIAFGFGGFL